MIKATKLYIDNLRLSWFIGIFDHEYERPQPVVLNIEMDTHLDVENMGDDGDNMVCYKGIVEDIKCLRDQGHIRLVETLAHRVADICLRDKRVRSVSVKVSKPNAFKDAENVGIILIKQQEKNV